MMLPAPGKPRIRLFGLTQTTTKTAMARKCSWRIADKFSWDRARPRTTKSGGAPAGAS